MTSAEPDIQTDALALSAAAEELGVHYMTAYRYVRTGRMLATKSGGQWWVNPKDLEVVKAEGTGIRPAVASFDSDGTRPMRVAQFTNRLVAGDTAGCWDMIVDVLASGATPVEVHKNLLAPSLDAVGTGWVEGDLSIADEHLATATASRLLGQLGPMFRRPGRRRGIVVLGGAAGDPHALPTAMMADVLSARHFDVVDLGANVPTESFLAAAQRADGLVGIGFSVTVDEVVPAALLQLHELQQALPGCVIVVGASRAVRAAAEGFSEVGCVVSDDLEAACDVFANALNDSPS